jgi:pyridoxamine 5'-phosphate oxidase
VSFHQNNPNEIFTDEWKDLLEAVKDASHDYHLMTLSTSSNNKPDLRTVVLRDVNKKEHSLSFHTDARSPKYDQIQINPSVSALFYSVTKRTQLRVSGQASLCLDDKLLKSKWLGMNKNSKECYLGKIAPSQKIPNGQIINEVISENKDKNPLLGLENFTRINIKISSMEILRLHHLGHKRLSCNLEKYPVEYNWLAS